MYAKVDWGLRLQELKTYPLDTRTITSKTVHNGPRYRKMVWVHCQDCNGDYEIYVDHILHGQAARCRCTKIKYHHPGARILQSRYVDIWRRCSNLQDANYGGRGIQNKFASAEEFVNYVLRELPHPNYKNVTLDRINNDGHYEPGNLRLATRIQQARNKRNNVHLEYKGQVLVLAELACKLKMDYPFISFTQSTIWSYLQRGVSWRTIVKRGRQKQRYTIS